MCHSAAIIGQNQGLRNEIGFRKGLQVFVMPGEWMLLKEVVHGLIHAVTGRLGFIF